jgi:hypothetical protein
MAKSAVLKKQPTPEFDFSDMMTDSADEAILGMMTGFIEAYRHQQQTAIELTKLIVEKNSAASMKEEEVFLIFKRAIQVVSEISPIKELWEGMNG